MLTPIELGRQIKQAREKRGWSQARLAKESGANRTSISSLERGKVGDGLPWGTIKSLDKVLNLELRFVSAQEDRFELMARDMGRAAFEFGMRINNQGQLLVKIDGVYQVLEKEMLG
jgi:transcriptional regulator with XRE-family HTH domain